MNVPNWHGLSDEEALALWDEYDWRSVLSQTLCEIATCEFLPIETRLLALQTLNTYTLRAVLPQAEIIPKFIIAQALVLTTPKSKVGWLARRRGRRAAVDLKDRLLAVRNVLATIDQFMNPADARSLGDWFNFTSDAAKSVLPS